MKKQEAIDEVANLYKGKKNERSEKLYYKAAAANQRDYFLVEVKILSEPKRVNFGRRDVVIEPVKGKGTLKVNYNNLIVE